MTNIKRQQFKGEHQEEEWGMSARRKSNGQAAECERRRLRKPAEETEETDGGLCLRGHIGHERDPL